MPLPPEIPRVTLHFPPGIHAVTADMLVTERDVALGVTCGSCGAPIRLFLATEGVCPTIDGATASLLVTCPACETESLYPVETLALLLPEVTH